MHKAVSYSLIFSTGVAIGSFVTWKMVKTKYERIAQEEIDSVKETFSKFYSEKDNDKSIDISEEKEEPEDNSNGEK